MECWQFRMTLEAVPASVSGFTDNSGCRVGARCQRPRTVTRQRHGTSGSPRPRDHLAGLREHHGVAGAASSSGGAVGRCRRR
jgi:hypothetical protein